MTRLIIPCVLFFFAPLLALADYREIQEGITRALQDNKSLGHYEVTIDVRRGVVVLRGEVGSTAARSWLEEIAFQQPGVERVDNLLAVVERTDQNVGVSSLANKVAEALTADGSIVATDLTVRTHGSEVVLNGEVPTAAIASRVEQMAFAVPGVESVRNELVVRNPRTPELTMNSVEKVLELSGVRGVAARFDENILVLSGDLGSHRAVDEVLAKVLMVEGVDKIRSEITVKGSPYPR